MFGGTLDRTRPAALALAKSGRFQKLAQCQDAGQRRTNIVSQRSQRRLKDARSLGAHICCRLRSAALCALCPWRALFPPRALAAFRFCLFWHCASSRPHLATARGPRSPPRTELSLGFSSPFIQARPRVVSPPDLLLAAATPADRSLGSISTACCRHDPAKRDGGGRSAPAGQAIPAAIDAHWSRGTGPPPARRGLRPKTRRRPRRTDDSWWARPGAPRRRRPKPPDRHPWPPTAPSWRPFPSKSDYRHARLPPSCRGATHGALLPPSSARARPATSRQRNPDRPAHRRDRAARGRGARVRRHVQQSRRDFRSWDIRDPAAQDGITPPDSRQNARSGGGPAVPRRSQARQGPDRSPAHIPVGTASYRCPRFLTKAFPRSNLRCRNWLRPTARGRGGDSRSGSAQSEIYSLTSMRRIHDGRHQPRIARILMTLI